MHDAKKSTEGVGTPGTGVSEDCELCYGCWKWNLGLLQEQQVLLNISPLSSSHESHLIYKETMFHW